MLTGSSKIRILLYLTLLFEGRAGKQLNDIVMCGDNHIGNVSLLFLAAVSGFAQIRIAPHDAKLNAGACCCNKQLRMALTSLGSAIDFCRKRFKGL